ncbi:MAG: zf-HC2 domain-containing protein [Terriglobia bacterium]
MSACREWEERLLDSALDALNGSALSEMEEHLESCPGCAAAGVALRRRREQLDTALRQLVPAAEPSPAFRARVLAALEARRAPRAWYPAQVGVLAAVAIVVLGGVFLGRLSERGTSITPPAATLSDWRSPTEGLLRSAADEWLQAPRLGQFYFSLEPAPRGTNKEKGGNNES